MPSGRVLAVLAAMSAVAGLAWLAARPEHRSTVSGLTQDEQLMQVTGELARSLERLAPKRKGQPLKPSAAAPADSGNEDWNEFNRSHGLAEYEQELRGFLGEGTVQEAARELLLIKRLGQGANDGSAITREALAQIDEDPAASIADLKQALDKIPEARDPGERTYLIQLVGRVADTPETRAQAVEIFRNEAEREARSPAAAGQATTADAAPADVGSSGDPAPSE